MELRRITVEGEGTDLGGGAVHEGRQLGLGEGEERLEDGEVVGVSVVVVDDIHCE